MTTQFADEIEKIEIPLEEEVSHVEKPSWSEKEYYNPGPYEAIKIIEHYNLNFHLGNVVKYVLRAGAKSEKTEIEDLEKAVEYLKRHIEFRKGQLNGAQT